MHISAYLQSLERSSTGYRAFDNLCSSLFGSGTTQKTCSSELTSDMFVDVSTTSCNLLNGCNVNECTTLLWGTEIGDIACSQIVSGATCADRAYPAVGYTCTCPSGWTSYSGSGATQYPWCSKCTTSLNTGCDGDSSSAVGGYCTDENDAYICQCNPGYSNDGGSTAPCRDTNGCLGVSCGVQGTCSDILAPGTALTKSR